MPINDDQFIDVHLEDPKISANQNSAGNKTGNNQIDEELDDLMFDMTTSNSR